ncbi:unnamed protein product [Rhizophagus irregularis]|uniref:Transmembrane protein n=1 Tax=Rhizophagus irregularis TaxID=588596 RepID=A0A916EJM6_9GLOM|nr:hypothetical protein OCT59_027926 [Rhizophagus irregularis]CAB4381338.1 unnamed protein product [Rhizophagus irregularis]CAB4440121.1 unnamed protein product [Rhizophagus irregularis]CAB4495500.1 unnamed protein product [Rhizophagus irregularis]CAB5190713.1 unnamed protein product [Rhizophagus irregularis]
MILKKICKYFLGILLGLPLFILILACPALDYRQFPLYFALEISYLVVAIFGPSNCCFGSTISKHGLQKILMWLLLLWIIIAILYTHYTWNEMNNIPFFCPSTYEYMFAENRIACQIRTANLLSMWSFLLLSILWVQFLCADWIDENLVITNKLVNDE